MVEITALVIDDDRDAVESMSECLELKGIKVVGKGYDGGEAAGLYQKLRPDLVLLDIMMPKYDGIYAAKAIRSIDPNSKIVMVTADLTGATAKELEKLELDHVYKPFDIDDIMARIAKLNLAGN